MPKKVYLMMAVAVALGFMGGAFLTAVTMPGSNAFAQVSNTKTTKILHPAAIQTEQSEIQKEVQAKSFKLYNGSNKLIATLATSKDGLPELNFYDPRSNQTRLKLYLEDSSLKTKPQPSNEGYLPFFDQTGNFRFRVFTDSPSYGGLAYTLQEDKFFLLPAIPIQRILFSRMGKAGGSCNHRLINPWLATKIKS